VDLEDFGNLTQTWKV